MQYRTLLIGEKVDTMRKLAQGMSRADMPVQVVDSVHSAMHDFTTDQVSAIVLGRLLPKSQRCAIMQHWRMLRPDIPVVHVRAPIGELVAEMVKAAAFKTSGYEPIASSLSARGRTISFPTMITSNIEIALYHQTPMRRTRIRQIYKEEFVLSGQQIVHIPRNIFGYGGQRFAVVTINEIEKHVLLMR